MKGLARKFAFAVGAAAALSLGEAVVRDTQVAHADNWQYYASNLGGYCEGCCSARSICCEVGYACKVPAGEEG